MSHIKYTACGVTILSLVSCDNHLYGVYALLSSSYPKQLIVMVRYPKFKLKPLRFVVHDGISGHEHEFF